MLLYRYKASFPNDDSGPRIWFFLINLVLGFMLFYGFVSMYNNNWFWLIGFVMTGVLSSSINISGLRKPYLTYWGSIFIFGSLLVLFFLFYCNIEIRHSINLFFLIYLSFIALLQLLAGQFFFRKFKNTII